MNGTTLQTIGRAAALLGLLLVFGPSAAHAAGDWRVSITPYAWATDVGMNADLDGRQVVDKKVPVSDLIKVLDTTVQVRAEVQHKALGLSLDLFDVVLKNDKTGIAIAQVPGATADVSSDIGMTILDVAGFYDPHGNGQGFSFLYGARIIDESATVDATFMPAPGVSVPETYQGNDTMVDGLLGIRYTKRFTRHWGTQMRADVSTGGTDYTWSAGPSISYAFGKMGRHGLSVGYRTMKVDFQESNGVDSRMTLSGVLIGLRTSF